MGRLRGWGNRRLTVVHFRGIIIVVIIVVVLVVTPSAEPLATRLEETSGLAAKH